MAGLFGPAPKEPYYAKRVRGEVPKGYRQVAGFLAETPGFAGDAVSAADLISGIKDKDWLKASLAGVSLLPGIPNLGGIIIGRKAKTFDEGAAKQYLENKTAGAPKETNWALTGTGQTPLGDVVQEIDDSGAYLKSTIPVVEEPKVIYSRLEDMTKRNADGLDEVAYKQTRDEYARQMDRAVRLGNIFEHPELYKAYPEIADMRVSGLYETTGRLRGSLSPGENRIRVKSSADPDQQRSTLLHEIQHAIQFKEGFPLGGNTSQAEAAVDAAMRRDMSGPTREKAVYNAIAAEVGQVNRVRYARRLKELSTSETITPRRIFNQAGWYEHGDKIRQELGPMPKRSGEEQKRWLRDAADRLYRHEDAKGRFDSPYHDLSDRDLVNMLRRQERKLDKQQPKLKEFFDQENRWRRINQLGPGEKYLAHGGEAESRLVQARRDLNPVERKVYYPFGERDAGYPYAYDMSPSLLFRP